MIDKKIKEEKTIWINIYDRQKQIGKIKIYNNKKTIMIDDCNEKIKKDIKNIISGVITITKIKTYLFGIYKKTIINTIKRKNKTILDNINFYNKLNQEISFKQV